MANIGVIGWYDHGNCGDESYKLSFPRVFPQHKFVFSERPIQPYLDAYILGGGDIVCDAFINELKPIKKKHIISAAISQPNKKLSEFEIVAARDFRSLGNAAASGVHAQYVPDFAFALEGNKERGLDIVKNQFKAIGHDFYKSLVTVVINAHLIPDHAGMARELFSFQHMSFELAKAMDQTAASFLFVPFGTRMPWDDRISGSWVASRCKFWKKNAVVYDALSVQDTIDIIAASDAVISSRLHSTIFSCVASTPFIDITHNHKNLGFLETTGLIRHSIKYEGVEAGLIVDKLKTLIGSAEVREELTKVTNKQRMILKEFAQNVHLD
jgi:polysaccharide pyruvyl transferase WcaK-like protein